MLKRLSLFLLFLALTNLAWANSNQQLISQLEPKLKQLHPNLSITHLAATPLENFYAVELNSGDLIYAHKNGEFLFAGNLLRLTSQGIEDLTELATEEKRQTQLSQLNKDQQIIYPAKGKTKAVIQVFTDTSCPYCVKLHEEIPQLNQLGVEVRYLAFPRQGVHSQAYADLQTAWCSKNPAEALTQIKQGKKIANQSCTNPIQQHYELGKQLGVQGTPAIILPSGRLIPGYLKANSLAQELGIQPN